MTQSTGRFKTNYNEDFFPDQGEVNTEPSKTVPDMSLSISELLNRVQRGIPVTGNENPAYDEEDPDDSFYTIPDFDKLDLAEKEEYARAAQAEVQRLRSVLAEKAKIAREAQEKAAKEAQRKEWDAQRKSEEVDKDKPLFGHGHSHNTNIP